MFGLFRERAILGFQSVYSSFLKSSSQETTSSYLPFEIWLIKGVDFYVP